MNEVMIAIERIPEVQPVDYLKDNGEEVPKQDPEPSKQFSRAIEFILSQQQQQQQQPLSNYSETSSSSSSQQQQQQQQREKWERIHGGISNAMSEMERMVILLQNCEIGTYNLSRVEKQPQKHNRSKMSLQPPPQHQQKIVLTSKQATISILQKREILRSSSQWLLEALQRIKMNIQTKEVYFKEVSTLGRNWRLSVAPGFGKAVQQVECLSCSCFPSIGSQFETLLPDNEGRITLSLPTTELRLSLQTLTTSQQTPNENNSSATTTIAHQHIGVEECNFALSLLEKTMCSKSLMNTLVEEAIRIRQSSQTSFHAVVKGENSILVSCGGSLETNALKISLSDSPEVENTNSGIITTTENDDNNNSNNNDALLAVAEDLSFAQWKAGNSRVQRDGAIVWNITTTTTIQSSNQPSKQKHKQAKHQPSQTKQLQRTENVIRGRGILESITVLHAHRITVKEVSKILDSIVELPELFGVTTVHWGPTTRSPVAITPFCIFGLTKLVKGAVEGPYIRVGTSPVGINMLSSVMKALLI